MPGSGSKSLSVRALASKYLAFAHIYYRGGLECRNIRYALADLLEIHGELPAESLSPGRLKTVRDAMSRRLCYSLVNKRIGIIRRMYRWAVEEELVEVSVLQALAVIAPLKRGRSIARDTSPVLPVPEDHYAATLEELHPLARAAAEVMYWTGMRPGEALRMRTGDLDRQAAEELQSDEVLATSLDSTANLQVELWLYRPEHHKTEHLGYARNVWIGTHGQEALRPWLRADPQAFIFDPRHVPRSRSQNCCYTPNSYRSTIYRACDRSRVPRWSPNRLRHNAATRICKLFGFDAARAVLDHRESSASVTERYAERDLLKAMEVMRRIG